MKVKILKEAGVDEALLGLSLSYNSQPSKTVADRLCFKNGGHNKFLESVQVWLDIEAPRYFWQQFDTYRVGTSKQSESTMHTLMRSQLTSSNFQDGCNEKILKELNWYFDLDDFDSLKRHLPESFLQRRIVNTNYRVIQSIVSQRISHKLKEWGYFISTMKSNLEYPEWVFKRV